MKILLIIISALIVIYIIYIYNKIVKALNMNKEAFSNIDVALKQRYDLVPNLVETVKGYTNYEGDILSKVTSLRSGSVSMEQRANLETDFSKDLKNILVIMEQYPNLKASEQFLEFQKNLVKIEETIELSRRYYNGTTRQYNILLQKFPNNILLKLLGYKELDYFEVELVTRQKPEIQY